MARNFKDLSEREILALAISLEEEDGRIYGDFADGLRDRYPASAKIFEEMQSEESAHRTSLIETYRQRFGEHIPLIRRQDVKGFVQRRAVWLLRPLGISIVRKQAEIMELETRRFYKRWGTPRWQLCEELPACTRNESAHDPQNGSATKWCPGLEAHVLRLQDGKEAGLGHRKSSPESVLGCAAARCRNSDRPGSNRTATASRSALLGGAFIAHERLPGLKASLAAFAIRPHHNAFERSFR
jgi:rubrerythrin